VVVVFTKFISSNQRGVTMLNNISFFFSGLWSSFGEKVHYWANTWFGPDQKTREEIAKLEKALATEEKYRQDLASANQQLEKEVAEKNAALAKALEESQEQEAAFQEFKEASLNFVTGYHDFKSRAAVTKAFVSYLIEVLRITPKDEKALAKTEPKSKVSRLTHWAERFARLRKKNGQGLSTEGSPA
tara:strand:- start:378 stop:938 length:561 start_codon:yes stop_codon:yes gene_type:complete